MWAEHNNFKSIIQSAWKEKVDGSSGYILTEKLRRTRKALKIWNKTEFGNVHQNIHDITAKIENMEKNLQDKWSDQVAMAIDQLNTQLNNNIS
ncbi:hypothetical protein CASFOL_041267 [Castilleja foliolosa]|uniref:Uncharacterized protein n=1 Tax=Castilleja foliolosa TaxID=1961234 RepID=A0ABD3BDX6_9LAMI